MKNHRRAFTLMEMLLTLSLLGVIMALAWPMLDKPFANHRLRKAADVIRAEWGGARVEAINSGSIIVFRYTADAETFRLESRASQQGTTGETSMTGGLGGLSDGGLSEPKTERLPKGVTFVAAETAEDSRAAALASDIESSLAGERDWSEPILFYPDGTTSDAQLTLKNENSRCIELRLRGLTGVVKVSPIKALEAGL